MNLSNINFDYLQLAAGPERVQHPADYIKSGKNEDGIRRIYHAVAYDDFERKKIQEFKNYAQQKKKALPLEWTDADILKRLYAQKFDNGKVIELLDKYNEWKNNPINKNPGPKVFELLTNGTAYIYGRDHLLRPILIFNLGKLDTSKTTEDEFFAAASILMNIATRYCFVPGKIENMVVILDVRDVSMMKFPIGALKGWEAIGSACYPRTNHHTYVIGSGFALKMSWKAIEAMADSRASKTELIDTDELNKLKTNIHESMLEKKFGGKADDLKTFFPPDRKLYDKLRDPSKREKVLKKKFKLSTTASQPIAKINSNEYYDQLNRDIYNVTHSIESQPAIKSPRQGILRGSTGSFSPTKHREDEYSYRKTYDVNVTRSGDPQAQYRSSFPATNNDHWNNTTQEQAKRSFRAQIFEPTRDYNFEPLPDMRGYDRRIDRQIDERVKRSAAPGGRNDQTDYILHEARRHDSYQYDQRRNITTTRTTTTATEVDVYDLDEDHLLQLISRENKDLREFKIPDETHPLENQIRGKPRNSVPKFKREVDARNSRSPSRGSPDSHRKSLTAGPASGNYDGNAYYRNTGSPVQNQQQYVVRDRSFTNQTDQYYTQRNNNSQYLDNIGERVKRSSPTTYEERPVKSSIPVGYGEKPKKSSMPRRKSSSSSSSDDEKRRFSQAYYQQPQYQVNRSPSRISQSNTSNRHIEEWKFKQQIRDSSPGDDEDDGRGVFCGFCVRRKPATTAK